MKQGWGVGDALVSERMFDTRYAAMWVWPGVQLSVGGEKPVVMVYLPRLGGIDALCRGGD